MTIESAQQTTKTSKRKTALITGGSRGIGAAIAQQFANSGYEVAFTYRSNQEAAQETARRITAETNLPTSAIHLDLEQEQTIAPAIQQAVGILGGKIDVLVNNAGYADMSAPAFLSISPETLKRTITTNVIGPFLVTQAAAPHISPKGSVVNIGSCLGNRVPSRGLTSYATSKAAITGFTRGLARDLGELGIRVNEIAPGSIDTEMNPADGPASDYQRSTTVFGEYGVPDDVARAAVFIASEEASYITGATLAVDGGTNA
ncbi:3-oxoacyl-[acyl-carrier protein] reductase [Arthrobacter sp. JUb119]|uniref:SDR family NAD(P)-dependent oxidoreductase n=1 Tax=Arthrobacter sp. JUb115 TaxID=2485108 RepID=UPI0010D63DC6|nr:SDR family oxidoreductase [Arthrobacter sp. JUb115]MCS3494496.1 3-oxoacyl-[acyl-carrier protein] reductase [Arthrobacter sp. JUb119]TDU22586.1 3-oxoacyl-[acyl-carrier protein] reductase [Arthrobacter sp. JUb115]